MNSGGPESIADWPDRLEGAIGGTFIDRVVVLEETLSTQDAAARACHGMDPDHRATLVIASRQLMGRGQRANTWFDAPGMTLPCSIAMGPELFDHDSANLAARAGLAAMDAVRVLAPNSEVLIQWPNDIVIRGEAGAGKKIAGVLIEHAKHSVVIGIGINCTQGESDWHPSIRDTAISLAQLGAESSRITLACHLVATLDHWLRLASDNEVRDHWAKHDALVGCDAKFVYNNRPYSGRVMGIDPLTMIRVDVDGSEVQLPVQQTRLIR